MITRLRIENYKSIESLDLELGPLTVLVGPNGCGKSNVVDALRFLGDAAAESLDQAVSVRHGIDSIRRWSPREIHNIKFSVNLSTDLTRGKYCLTLGSHRGSYKIKHEEAEINYALRGGRQFTADTTENAQPFSMRESAIRYRNKVELIHDSDLTVLPGQNEYYNINGEQLLFDCGAITLREMGRSMADFEAYSVFPNTLRQAQNPTNDNQLSATGDNLTSVFKMFGRTKAGAAAKANILRALSVVMPSLESISIKRVGGFMTPVFRVREADGTRHDYNVSQISDGTLRVFGLLTALYHPDRPSVIAIEEPEQTVNPGILLLLAEAMQEVSADTRIIVTTHSPELVDHFPPEAIRAVEMVDGVTKVTPVSEVQVQAARERLFSLGELMVSEGLFGD